MPPRRKPATIDAARLRVLAAGDEQPFRAALLDLLRGKDRLAREAALDALAQRPLEGLRDILGDVYDEVDRRGEKLDPGGRIRGGVIRALLHEHDPRDAGLAYRAAETREHSMGVDGTANLRALGLRLCAAVAPDDFPYLAVQHVEDASTFSPEPAATALRLLAESGHDLAVYQWLVNRRSLDPALVEGVLDLLAGVPADILARCLSSLARDALAGPDEALLTKLAETIVERESSEAYPALATILRGAISEELHAYLALLLASSNRPPLLTILEHALEDDIRRRPAIIAALRARTTPEQAAILARWEERA